MRRSGDEKSEGKGGEGKGKCDVERRTSIGSRLSVASHHIVTRHKASASALLGRVLSQHINRSTAILFLSYV